MSKILFIEPKAPDLHIYSKVAMPRLGNVVLATMARERGWDAEVIVEQLSGLDPDNLPPADVVGISSITSTAPRAYRFADAYRRSGVPVIMGGPHISFLPDEAMCHSDYIIKGEGEIPFSRFLDALESGGGWDSIPNFSYHDGGEIRHNRSEPSFPSLADVPTPDLSLIRSYWRKRRRRIVPVETSRGCPFNCTFCSVSKIFGRRMRFRPIDSVIDVLKRHRDRASYIFFVDDNFAAVPSRTKELLSAVIDAGLKIQWSAQVRSDAARDPELLGLMRDSGCVAVYVGIESINPQTLKRIKKGQRIEEVSDAIERFHRHGVRVHGMFILGFDEDNAASARNTVRYAMRTKLNSVQFLLLTPLPGTQFFSKLRQEKRILTDNWSLYDAHHVVFRPRRMLPLELQRLQIKAHEKFYSLIRQVKHLFSFKFVEYAIAEYASRINKNWKSVNHFFMRWLKKLSRRGKGPLEP